jgi:hypothetical protein
MKKLFLAGFLLTSVLLSAQNYKSALGLRLNHYSGALTYKWFMSETNALDWTLSTGLDDGGFTITGLYELHTPTSLSPQLQWYYGLGGFFSLYGNDAVNYLAFGVNGVLGIEYAITEIPFAISLDYIPAIGIRSNNYKNDAIEDDVDLFTGFQGWTLGIKYTFGSYVHDGNKE